MTSDDLKRLFLGPTLFRLDTVLSPRLVPVLYVAGLVEIVVFGGFGLVVLRVVCEALLVFFKTHEEATDSVSRTRISSTLLEEVRDAIADIADEEDDEDLITPATVPSQGGDVGPARTPRRTARRTPKL
jgi:hypothetical protein